MHKIVLLGYMGSGKTTVGGLLAKALNYSFIDLDKFIEKNEGLSVSKIFETKGELYFRAQERKYLEVLLDRPKRIVLSLGGGTPCYYDTMDYIVSHNDVKSLYLNAGIDILANRLKNENQTRPILSHIKNIDDIKEFIAKHLFERNLFYKRAHFQIKTDKKTLNKIVVEIQEKLS